MPLPVHHLGLAVSDLERSAEFYKQFGGEEVSAQHFCGPEFELGLGVHGADLDARMIVIGSILLELVHYNGTSIEPYRARNCDAGASHIAFADHGLMHCNDDYVFMPLQAGTQWDGLSHVFYEDRLYNDVPSSTVTFAGAQRLGIETQAKGVVGRGVLLDVAHHLNVKWMAAGQVITGAQLDEVATAQGVSVLPGDILLVRTGWRRKFLNDGDGRAFLSEEPGLGLDACQWLSERNIAAVASDNWAVEAKPFDSAEQAYPVHMVLIRDMGMLLGEMWDFEELAVDCRQDGTWEFLLTAPVLKFTGAVGSPINPLAIK